MVRSPLTAASATFALKAGVWFRRGRLFMVSPDSQAQRARCQAETPLIDLFKFASPALITTLYARSTCVSPRSLTVYSDNGWTGLPHGRLRWLITSALSVWSKVLSSWFLGDRPDSRESFRLPQSQALERTTALESRRVARTFCRIACCLFT